MPTANKRPAPAADETTEAVAAEQAETTEATVPEPARTTRPHGDILGALLDDPRWGEVPTLAAKCPMPPVPVYTTGIESYEQCIPVTEAELQLETAEMYHAAWLRTHSPNTARTAA